MGDFHPEIVRITSAFDGPLAIVSAHGIHLKEPSHGPLHILVPVNGTVIRDNVIAHNHFGIWLSPNVATGGITDNHFHDVVVPVQQ